jgi:hypothetical protein
LPPPPLRRAVYFNAKALPRPILIDEARFQAMEVQQNQTPAWVWSELPDKSWWWHKYTVYLYSGGGVFDDAAALVFRYHEKKARSLEHAQALMAASLGPAQVVRREGIPEDIKRAVWRRCQNRCVKCGSQEVLEIDHILPVAMGGRSSLDNLQLLCITCNRQKGATIS